ncbi:hypothetical protein CLF_109695 [Clonorchis sinensis]|uniref:Uncharacterized protein n=1 Tax=Clonorchis sinensis TaxID=79923 RepID=G7YJN4_CLOSI|nr:hypothetical protein CLF_109695 [Clonorchis sinensis]
MTKMADSKHKNRVVAHIKKRIIRKRNVNSDSLNYLRLTIESSDFKVNDYVDDPPTPVKTTLITPVRFTSSVLKTVAYQCGSKVNVAVKMPFFSSYMKKFRGHPLFSKFCRLRPDPAFPEKGLDTTQVVVSLGYEQDASNSAGLCVKKRIFFHVCNYIQNSTFWSNKAKTAATTYKVILDNATSCFTTAFGNFILFTEFRFKHSRSLSILGHKVTRKYGYRLSKIALCVITQLDATRFSNKLWLDGSESLVLSIDVMLTLLLMTVILKTTYGSIPSVTIVMERKTTLKKSLSQLRPVIKVGTLAAKRAIDPQTYLFDSDFSNGPCCRITRRRQTSDLAKGGAVKKLTYVNAKASAMETLLFSKEDEKFMERVEDAMKLARMTGEQCRISDAEVVLDASSYRREKLKCHMKEKNFSTGDLPDIILILKEEL